METSIWLFPIIFCFHNLEEIIGMHLWLEHNQEMLRQNFPKIHKLTKDFSIEGLAFATLEELIVCLLLCSMVYFTNNLEFWWIWLGAFIACAVHFLGHILQALIIKKYIPALASSLICLPLSIWIIYKIYFEVVKDFEASLIYLMLGFIVVFINLIFAQRLIGIFTRAMRKR